MITIWNDWGDVWCNDIWWGFWFAPTLIVGGVGVFVIFVIQVGIIFNTQWNIGNVQSSDATVAAIGKLLLNEYLLPFEIVSILLLAALMGAALLSRRT